MIKVLKTNFDFKETTCPCCGSELAYQKWDVENQSICNLMYFYLNCPVCHERFIVEKMTAEEWFEKVRNN